MYSIWSSDRVKNTYEQKKKEMLKVIGNQVDSFFIDKMKELGFEERSGQWEMGLDIVQAMIDNKHILVEAGVGIGKTYAYVVPMMFYHKQNRKPIIIATSTIALQEQLANDIKIIEEILDYYPEVLSIKGQNHFLCLNRLEEYFSEKRNTKEYKYYETINGGGHEKSDWDIEIPEKIWNKINVFAFNPIMCRQRCLYKENCFYYQLRMNLRETDGFVLCNQDLLVLNMKKRKNANNEMFAANYEYIIIDEVHNLESRVRNSFTISVTCSECKRMMDDVIKNNRRMGSVLDEKVNHYLLLIDKIFGNLLFQIKRQDRIAFNKDKEIEKYYVDRNIPGLDVLVKELYDISEMISLDFGIEDTYKNRGDDELLEKIEDQYNFFKSLSKNISEDIFWMNANTKSKEGVIIHKCPKNVNELTENLLFSDNAFNVIMTSATISNGGKNQYDYFISNTNLPIDKTVLADVKESPFDYDNHAIIYYTEDIPHPSKEREDFIEKGVEEIVNILKITEGKALILFTAKRDMLEVYNKLCEKVSYKILMQKIGLSQSDVIKEFKKDINSVLLATGSYWEGISIEGRTLSNLIIFRLPFPVPEPIIDYKKKISKDGLMDVLVPEMIIKLKQGIGRLIRNKNDSGIVSIIDPRLGEKSTVSYKQLTWEALPIKNKTNDINKVKLFYEKIIN